MALQGAGKEQRPKLPGPALPLPPSLRAPFGANDPFSAAALRADTQERRSAAELSGRLNPVRLAGWRPRVGAWGRGVDVAEKRPLCPEQLMWLQLVKRRGPPSSAWAQEQTSLLTKKEKRRSDRGRGCAFHMTCPGTERVFVNPAVCQLASARRHKPLSATSPLTCHRVLGWAGLGGGRGGPALACTSCQLPSSCLLQGGPELC